MGTPDLLLVDSGWAVSNAVLEMLVRGVLMLPGLSPEEGSAAYSYSTAYTRVCSPERPNNNRPWRFI